jgi:hypothetical protein
MRYSRVTVRFMKTKSERRIVTNGKTFRVQHRSEHTDWVDAIWADYPTQEAAQKKLDELNAQDQEAWEPV